MIYRELSDAYNQGLLDAARIAGGWTGPENTLENASIVSAVCRAIRKEILKEKI